MIQNSHRNKKLTAKFSGDALCNNDDLYFMVEITLSAKIKVKL